MKYEYGVIQHPIPGLHRGPFATKQEAEKWIQDGIDDGMKEGIFAVVVRSVSAWREIH